MYEPVEVPLGKAEDLAGWEFGDFVVVYRCERSPAKGKKRTAWACRCKVCGTLRPVLARSILSGNTRGRHWTHSPISITYQGRTLKLSEWVGITGLNPDTVYWRHKQGWAPERILGLELHRIRRTETSAVLVSLSGLPSVRV